MKAVLAAVKNFLVSTHGGARHGLTHVCVCLALFSAWSMPRPGGGVTVERAHARVGERDLDAALQRAATGALGSRAGAVVILDAQTGRVRAAVNPRTAEEAAFPPGSAIKPFTLLAALRARAIDTDARLSCRKHYARRGADFTCSHPVYIPPFSPAQALAHSCNYYFARLAERLPHGDFNRTLAAYGFGSHDAAATFMKASVTVDAPAAGMKPATPPRLPRGNPQIKTALGEGDELLVTPLQLLAAYAALFNGGHLYRAQTAAPENFRARELARLDIAPDERALLLSGLRGAVRYGTAAPADLASLPTHVFGKTGTATDESDGVHTHGWFVGLASEREARAGGAPVAQGDAPSPAEVKLAVLVFLERGQGKESASVARAVFAEHARLTTNDNTAAGSNRVASSNGGAGDPAAAARTGSNSAGIVRVRLTRAEATRALPLDEYLFGVLAAEASVEDEFSALKAQAVVSRTYALSNLRRHTRDGYDFCDTTHCQRFIQITSENARPDFHELVRRAVGDTAGEVLRDARGSLASGVFFSTSCGGQTANLHALWGAPAREPHLRGVRDEYCVAMPHTRWTDAIPAARLAAALRGDARTDVGARIGGLSVVKRDATGRVEQLAIAGDRRRVVVRGWDFKIIVGRALGWSVLKSSRFEVMRAGDKFVFRGSGFGHGLGLCQNGAHVMAARGASYRQILAHYFPATSVGAPGLSSRAAKMDSATQVAQPASQTQARRAAPEFHEDAALENVSRPRAPAARPRITRTSSARAGAAQASFSQTTFAQATFAHAHLAQTTFAQGSLAHDRFAQASSAHTRFAPVRFAHAGFAHARFDYTRTARSESEFAHVNEATTNAVTSPVAATSPAAATSHVALTSVAAATSAAAATSHVAASSPSSLAPEARLIMSSENFRVSYPPRVVSRREAEAALAALEAARADARERLAAASIAMPALGVMEAFVHATTGDFTGATGQPAWVAAVTTRGRRIELQPLATLGKRGVLAPTLRHEYAHALINALSRSRAPLWLAEGLAAHFAGEGRALTRHASKEKLSREELDKRLAAPAANPSEMRALYAAAFREVGALIRAEGEASVWRRVARG